MITQHILYVGAVGSHGQGKSTMMDNLANLLKDEYAGKFNILRKNMADPLRDNLQQVAPYKLGASKRHPAERNVLQWMGEAHRAQDNNHWVRQYLRDTMGLAAKSDLPTIVLTDDIYHANEAMLMDTLVVVGEATEPPHSVSEYEPESIRQTRLLHHFGTALFPGTVVHLYPDRPEDLSTSYCQQLLVKGVRDALESRVKKGGTFNEYAA